jgi:FkbM family methyltransferase
MLNSRSSIRRAAGSATAVACRAVGRRNVVRASRFVLYRARLDVQNDLRTNGELSLQRWILELPRAGPELDVIDVGANIGRWSTAMLFAAEQAGRLNDLRLHAFEPSSYTFALLSEALAGHRVRMHQAALSDRLGSAALYVTAPGAGTNSLHAPHGVDSPAETVVTTTLDSYAEQVGLNTVTLIKIDAEGHDLAVLRGARELFAKQRISVAQFEYNHRWVYARAFLRDAFELLEPHGYTLGKLSPRGVEFYPGWEPELETFVEGNYVACASQAVRRLPSVVWWKAAKRGAAR